MQIYSVSLITYIAYHPYTEVWFVLGWFIANSLVCTSSHCNITVRTRWDIPDTAVLCVIIGSIAANEHNYIFPVNLLISWNRW